MTQILKKLIEFKRYSLAIISIFVCFEYVFAQVELLKNIPGTFDASSGPDNLMKVGGTLFFTAADFTHGVELWKTDGTENGTMMVKDIAIGIDGSGPRNFKEVNGILYFAADDIEHGYELWRSDGTEAGTYLVKDINPGYKSSLPQEMNQIGNNLIFAAEDNADGNIGNFLWVSDGSELGTIPLEHRISVATNLYENTQRTLVINDILFFTGFDLDHGRELWKSDGSKSGTVLIKDVKSGISNSDPSDFTNVDGELFFSALDESNNRPLWKSTGEESGTVKLYDESFTGLMAANGSLFFTGSDIDHGSELWKSDGTVTGTGLLKDINPGSLGSSIKMMAEYNSELYFAANDGVHDSELWKTDGTEVGTVMVKDAFSTYGGLNVFANVHPVISDNILYYFHFDELWRTDGTDVGTAFILDTNPSSSSLYATNLTAFNNSIFFSAYDQSLGRELWISDGTAGGTQVFKDIKSDGGASLGRFIADTNLMYFLIGSDLWVSDGAEVGTQLLKNIGTTLPELTFLDGQLYYANGNLWQTDGTLGGTIIMKDHLGNTLSQVSNLITFGSELYFAASDGVNGKEFWRSDGTDLGTMMVKDINVSGSSSPSNLIEANGMLYLTSNGNALWKSDGTEAGTLEVKSFSSIADDFAVVGSIIYFSASDGVSGYELWKSDGTQAGTVLVKDINTTSFDSYPANLTTAGGKVFFTAFENVHGRELWVSDGTDSGTSMVKDFDPSMSIFPPVTKLIPFSDELFFRGPDGELWKSDGTLDGTKVVRDIIPGPISSEVSFLNVANSALYFAARDLESGYEIWKLSENGCSKRITDSDVSISGAMTLFQGKLFFPAVSEFGQQIFSYDLANDPDCLQIDQFITFNEIETKVLGDAPFMLTATSSSGLEVTYSAESDGIMISGDEVTLLLAGRASITAHQDGNEFFYPAEDIGRGFCINPVKPSIAKSPDGETVTLTSSSTTGNQWYKDGTAMNGEINNTLIVSTPGIYKVHVTVDDCVSEFSNDIALIVTGDIDTNLSIQNALYPNPAFDQVTFSLVDFVKDKPVTITVTDMQGRVMTEFEGKGQHESALDVSTYNTGKYIAVMRQSNKTVSKQFIKGDNK